MRLKLAMYAVLFAAMMLSAVPTALATPGAGAPRAGFFTRAGQSIDNGLHRAGQARRGVGRYIGGRFSALGRQLMRPVRAIAGGMANRRQARSARNLDRAIRHEAQANTFHAEAATLNQQADQIHEVGAQQIAQGRERIAGAKASAGWFSRNVLGRLGLSAAGRAAARQVRKGRGEVLGGRLIVRNANNIRREANSAQTVGDNLMARAERRFNRAVAQEESANRLRNFANGGAQTTVANNEPAVTGQLALPPARTQLALPPASNDPTVPTITLQ